MDADCAVVPATSTGGNVLNKGENSFISPASQSFKGDPANGMEAELSKNMQIKRLKKLRDIKKKVLISERKYSSRIWKIHNRAGKS